MPIPGSVDLKKLDQKGLLEVYDFLAAKGYSRAYPKLVTGVIINSDGKATVKNSLRKKIVTEFEHLRNNPTDKNSRQRSRGLVTAARQADKSAYPNIWRFAFEKFIKE